MKRLRRIRIGIDDPHFALRCLDFMDINKYDTTFKLKESKLQEFLALSLKKGIQFDIIPQDEKNTELRFGQIWNWKKK